jgi:hypothetical protein
VSLALFDPAIPGNGAKVVPMQRESRATFAAARHRSARVALRLSQDQ